MVNVAAKTGTEEKLTRQRDAVLQVIREREDHPTANEIFQAARLRLPTISYATVYNSLRFWKEAGLVHEIKFGDSASRYVGRPIDTTMQSATIAASLSILISHRRPTYCKRRHANPGSGGIGSSDAQGIVSWIAVRSSQ